MFKKNNKSLASLPGLISSGIGMGIVAGFAGTGAMALSQMIEMKITKRPPSSAPADAAEKVLNVKASAEGAKDKFSQEVHWAYGTVWGLPRGIMSSFGFKGWSASTVHFAAIYTSALIVPTSLKVSSPLKEWSAKAFLVDALHHAVYVITAEWVADQLSDE